MALISLDYLTEKESGMKIMKTAFGFMIGFGVAVLCTVQQAVIAEEAVPEGSVSQPGDFAQGEVGVLRAAVESLTGDVYAEPSRWQPLSLGSFFSEGWNEAWASPSNGEGGAPRQGWLNAADGVFYRLNIATFGYAHGANGAGDQYTGGDTLYTSLSRRFALQYDVPYVVSKQGSQGQPSHTSFGDFQITPRFILSETKAVTQSFNLSFRTPTGDEDTGNGVAAVTPNYQFWANWCKGLVLRGSAGLSLPYDNVDDTNARSLLVGNLAVGYYFTPHECTPVGDLVGYVSANFNHAVDDRGPNDPTNVTITPGFRTHLGQNWYLLGGVEFPVTEPKSFDYQPMMGLMLVF